ITGGEPPITYMNTVRLGLDDARIHSLILGYWHTIVTPPMVCARNMVQVVEEMKAKGIVKPIVASLAGDVEVEEAAQYLYEDGIPAYADSTEEPLAVHAANAPSRRTPPRPSARSPCAPPSTSGREVRGCCRAMTRHAVGSGLRPPCAK